MAYEVRTVADRRERRDFLRLPFALYRGDPNWVPPLVREVRRTLDARRTPYFSTASLALFLCRRDGVPAARSAVVINSRHEEKFGERAAFFGFFEAEDDPRAVRLLFRAAEEYARARGARLLEGPFNPNHYSEVGLQIDGFGAPPSFFQPYNPPSYPRLLEGLGYRPIVRLQTMKNPRFAETLRALGSAPPGRKANRDITVRPARLDDLDRELEIIRDVNNDAFADNWHFLPLSREEYAFAAKHMRLVTRPGLVLIGEYRGRPAAVLHAVLDINPLLRGLRGKTGPLRMVRFLCGRRGVRNLIIFSAGIKKQYRHTGVFAAMLQAFAEAARGFEAAETTWISPDNAAAVAAAGTLNMRPDRSFAVYAKELCP